MERLTNKREADAQREGYERRLANGYQRSIPVERFLRLAAYEDTGLTPEEFAAYWVFIQDLLGEQKASEALSRFRELLKADKGGRLVVLPCKVGDTVWVILDGAKCVRRCVVEYATIGRYFTVIVFHTADRTREQYGVPAGAFGKTVFLTSEEAEKALEAMKNA